MPPIEEDWRPSLATWIAGGLIVAGLLLTTVSWWFLLLAAAGTIGPGILRELGWLNDRNPQQQLAAYRAGYHAYLTAAGLAFVLIALFRSTAGQIEFPQEVAMLLLTVLCFTWLLSWLVSYWGPRRAALRMLIGFGAAWLVFTILGNVGNEWRGWMPLLLHPLLALPFFALAWLSTRFPRIAGILLLAAALFFTQFFGLFQQENLATINQAVTLVLFVGPLIASGVALVASKVEANGQERSIN